MRQQLAQLGNGAHALAIQILGNADDAADAVHDAFTRVLTRPGAYQPARGPLKPWFLQIVRNCCIDMIRRRRPGTVNVDELTDSAAGPEQTLEISQRDRALRQALARLPAEQREILVLRDHMDLSYAEVADVLGIAKGTVMSRLHRARLALKEELLPYG